MSEMLMFFPDIFDSLVDVGESVLVILLFAFHENLEPLLSCLFAFQKLFVLLPTRRLLPIPVGCHLVLEDHPRKLLVYLLFLMFL
jgi:hypothetical protein